MTGNKIGQPVRIAAYAVAVAASALMTATVSSERLVAFASVPSALGFGLLLGVALAGVALGVVRIAAPAGCGTFAIAALAVAVLAYVLVGVVEAGTRVTFAGALVGGVLAMLAAGAVFTLFDENRGAPAKRSVDE